MQRWKCQVCGYLAEGDSPPAECPVCGAGADCFELVADAAPARSPAPIASSASRVIVIGAGIAGVSAAEALRSANPQVRILLIEREQCLPYWRLNLTRLLSGEIGEEALPLHPASWYEEQRIELLPGMEVTGIDPATRTVQLADGRSELFDQLILATGADSFIPPIPGAGRPGVQGFRTLNDARRILGAPRTGGMVIIGGGILGLELAGALARHHELPVTVIEGAPWLMPNQLNRRAGERLQRHVERLGVQFIANARVDQLSGADASDASPVTGVKLADGQLIPAERVILAVGVRPNLILARQAGLEIHRGLVVSDYLETNNTAILAAGDLTEHQGILYGLWPAAHYQGKIAGLNAASQRTGFAGIPRANTLKVLDIDLFSIGRVAADPALDQVFELDTEEQYRYFIFRDQRLAGAIVLGHDDLSPAVRATLEDGTDFSALLASAPTASEIIETLRNRSTASLIFPAP